MTTASEPHRYRMHPLGLLTCELCAKWYDDPIHTVLAVPGDVDGLALLCTELEILVESYSRRIRELEGEVEQLRRDVDRRRT